jgi:predicted DsbA family dithiol-disulfide isomerase
MEKKLTVQVWSDVICPWCWIAERSFQQALAKFAHRSEVDIVHRAYRLRLGETRRPVEEMLAKKFGTQVDPLQFLSQMEAVAAQDGLPSSKCRDSPQQSPTGTVRDGSKKGRLSAEPVRIDVRMRQTDQRLDRSHPLGP